MREEKEWKKDITGELLIYAVPSWISGVWPLLPNNFFTAFRYYVAVIFLFSTILTLGSELIQNCGSTRQTTDQLVFCAVTLNSTTKTILLRIFRKKVANNYKEAEKDWSSTEDEDFLEIMKAHKKLSRKVYFFEAVLHYILFTMYMIAPKLSEERILPLSTACLSTNISDFGYQGVYFLQILQTFYVFNGNIGTDFFFFAIVMHICGQVKILRINLSRIESKDFNDKTENEENFEESLKQRKKNEKEFSSRMNLLIKRHVTLINLANDVQNTLSITLLVQLSNSIVIMCILGLQTLLFLQTGDTVSAGRTLSGYLIVALGLFLYCYMGDYLEYQFEKVSEAAYNCHWYKFSSKTSRNVINIQMRASHLVNLSAGKMCNMNLELFKTSMKTAMSFFSVMRIISTVLMIGTEVYFSIAFQCGELRQAADHFLFWTVTVIATIKTILLRFHRNKLLKNCNSARSDWLTDNDPESLKIMTHHAKVSRIVFIFQALFSYFTLVMYVIAPMASTIEDDQALPLQTVCVFRNMSIMEYKSVYFLQAVQQLYIVNGNIGTDYFFFAMIMHVCGQAQILSLQFNKFGSRGIKYEEKETNSIIETNIKDEEHDEYHDKECFRKIRILINRHCELLSLANDLEESLNYILLVQFTMDIIMMCLTGLLTLIYLKQGDTVTAGRTICGFSIVVMSLFIYCYIGDYLQYRFEKTAEAIYSCYWYTCSPKISKNIIHIQTRGRHLMNLTAGKFCIINLEMFKTAMKTAMSFFSVMRILLDKNDELEL